ncbi:MAG: hypothetical protein KAS04_06925 [Candidatus Aenigmarchaeota archaeon]|nr:hypothetical protein [Candidatus Aenigmarchaeota archaeon]
MSILEQYESNIDFLIEEYEEQIIFLKESISDMNVESDIVQTNDLILVYQGMILELQ